MKQLKTKKTSRIIIISVVVLCLAAASIAVYSAVNRELPISLEKSRISEVRLESNLESRLLTASETEEFVRRFNLFDVRRQNRKSFAVSSDLVLTGTPVTYTVSFDDGTKLEVSSFADGVYNLGGETKDLLGKTFCTAAGVVKNADAYEEYQGMLLD